MLGLMIMVFVTLGLMAAGAAANFYMLSQTQATLAVQQNQVRIQAISDTLRSRFTVIDGQVAFSLDQMPKDGADYSARLPKDLVFTSTSTGHAIVFCPVIFRASAPAETASFLQVAEGEQYPIDVSQGHMVAGWPSFSSASGAPDPERLNRNGIYGFLISPNPKNSLESIPGCAAIEEHRSETAQAFLIDGGSVAPVFANMAKVVSTTYEVGSTTGDKDGLKVVGTLADALRLIERNEQSNARVAITTDITLSSVDIAAMNTVGKGRNIEVVAQGGDVTVAEAAKNDVLRLPGHWTFSDIDLGSLRLASTPDTIVTFKGSRLGSIVANGGEVRLDDFSQLTGTGSSEAAAVIIANSGRVTLASALSTPALVGNFGSQAAFLIGGGEISLEQSATLASGMLPYPGPVASSKSVSYGDGTQIIDGTGSPISGMELLYRTVTSADQTFGECTSDACHVSCPVPLAPITAGCSSANDQPVAKMGWSDGNAEYSCKWATVVQPGPLDATGIPTLATINVSNPVANVTCGRP